MSAPARTGAPAPRRLAGALRLAAIGLAGAVLMWLSLAVTLAMTVPEEQPRLVLSLWPSAAIARTAIAIGLMQQAPAAAAGGAPLALAGAALAHEPVLAAAASTYGAAAGLAGDDRRAGLAYAEAERLSRRDLQSQLWFIEHTVQAGDVAGALRHYDIALRANPPYVGAKLLPVLAKASAGEAVRRPLIAMLRERPNWRTAYLQTMLNTPLPPLAVADQLAGGRLASHNPGEASILSIGLSHLVQAKHYQLAAATLPNIKNGVRNGSFEQAPSLFPFDWSLSGDEDLLAYREPSGAADGAYVLHIASKERGGPLARQLVVLPAGQYVLSGLADNDGAASGSVASIAIACAERQEELIATKPLVAPAGRKWRFSLTFMVPTHACEAQWIIIAAPTGSSVSGWLDALRLQRAGGRMG